MASLLDGWGLNAPSGFAGRCFTILLFHCQRSASFGAFTSTDGGGFQDPVVVRALLVGHFDIHPFRRPFRWLSGPVSTIGRSGGRNLRSDSEETLPVSSSGQNVATRTVNVGHQSGPLAPSIKFAISRFPSMNRVPQCPSNGKTRARIHSPILNKCSMERSSRRQANSAPAACRCCTGGAASSNWCGSRPSSTTRFTWRWRWFTGMSWMRIRKPDWKRWLATRPSTASASRWSFSWASSTRRPSSGGSPWCRPFPGRAGSSRSSWWRWKTT